MELYKNHIGEKHVFEKGDKVPQWLFDSEVCFFGIKTEVKCESKQVEMKALESFTDNNHCIIHARNKNGEKVNQVCPPIRFITNNVVNYKNIIGQPDYGF